MCWNKTISLNTFIFAVFVIGLLYINRGTKYDPLFPCSNYYYIFLLSICSMQLVEYFIWNNLENKNASQNTILSLVTFILLILQPIFSLLQNKNKYTNNVLIFYIVCLLLLIVYKSIFNPFEFKTNISNGHLNWQCLDFKGIELLFILVWLICICYSFIYNGNILNCIIILFILVFCLYSYYKYNTWGSMWCWILNSIFIYYIIKMLIWLPYKEYNSLC